MGDDCYSIDLVMLSKFGRADGGRETWAYNFIPLLLESNKNLSLTIYGFSIDNKSDKREELLSVFNNCDRERVKLHFFPVKWPRIPLFFSMFYQLRKHVRGPDDNCTQMVLGVGGLFEMLMLLYTRKYNKSKKILWLRSIFFNEKADRAPSWLLPFLRRVESLFLKKADVLFANGDDIACHYKRYGLNAHVIKNGVDIQKWAIPKPVLGPQIKVAFIGRLTKVKGIEEFLQMVEMVKCGVEASRFDFHVVGKGPYSDLVETLERQGMLSSHGEIDNNDLPQLLKDFDVCVALTMASSTGGGGGTSNALMEQMAAGRVIVAWDNVIFSQLLNDENAYLTPQGDPQGLIDAISDIAENKDRAHSRAVAGKALMSEYSIETQLVKFQNILK